MNDQTVAIGALAAVIAGAIYAKGKHYPPASSMAYPSPGGPDYGRYPIPAPVRYRAQGSFYTGGGVNYPDSFTPPPGGFDTGSYGGSPYYVDDQGVAHGIPVVGFSEVGDPRNWGAGYYVDDAGVPHGVPVVGYFNERSDGSGQNIFPFYMGQGSGDSGDETYNVYSHLVPEAVDTRTMRPKTQPLYDRGASQWAPPPVATSSYRFAVQGNIGIANNPDFPDPVINYYSRTPRDVQAFPYADALTYEAGTGDESDNYQLGHSR